MKVIKIKNIIFLISITLLFSCVKKPKIDKEFYPTGELKIQKSYYTNDKKSYDYCSYYKNGNIEEKYSIMNGLIEGNTYKYSEKGVLLFKDSYKQGKLNGVCRSYTINGGLLRKFLYIEDIQKVYVQMYKSKKVKDELLYEIFNIEHEKSVPNGMLLFRKGELIPDSCYYYTAEIKDTITYGQEAKLKIKAYTKRIPKCSLQVSIGDLDNNLNFKDTSNIISLSSNTLEVNCDIKKYQLGNNLLLGKIIVYKYNFKQNKLIKDKLDEFILFKDFFVKSSK